MGNTHSSDRRTVLKATAGMVATAGLAGCSAIGGSGSPRYSDVERDDLFPGRDILAGTWNEARDVDFEGLALESVDETQMILMNVEVFEDVQAAKDNYDTSKSKYREPEDYDLADSAFWDEFRDTYAVVFFRDSNVVGQTAATGWTGSSFIPNREKAIQMAEDMQSYWQEQVD